MIKNAKTVYLIYGELSKRFRLDIPSCRELESSAAQDDAGLLEKVEWWFRQADRKIEVRHLRELLSQMVVSGSALHSLLAWHLGKEPKDKSDRDKIDFLLVQYLAECLPADVPPPKLSFEKSAEVLRPVLGETVMPKRLPAVEDCIRNLKRCLTLADFLEYSIPERGQELKAVAQKGPFDAAKLVAFTQFSFLLRLTSIRVLQEDLRALERDLKELEKRGIGAVEGISAGVSERQSIGQVRKLCEQWKQYFPGKYAQDEWFSDVIRLRSSVKQALQITTGRTRVQSGLGHKGRAARKSGFGLR